MEALLLNPKQAGERGKTNTHQEAKKNIIPNILKIKSFSDKSFFCLVLLEGSDLKKLLQPIMS